MSSHSMKYHNVPSLSLLEAYKSGKLRGENREWVEQSIAQNPMVAGVVESLDVSDIPAIKTVASSIHDRVVLPRLKHRGFWTKYAGWIGLSSIIILVGFFSVLELNKPEPRYANETMGFSGPQLDADAKVTLSTNQSDEKSSSEMKAAIPNQEKEKLSATEDEVEKPVEDFPNEEETSKANETNDRNTETPVDQKSQESSKEKSEVKENATKQENTYDNTREFGSEDQTNQSVLLAVSNVQILSKSNPDAMNTRSTGGGGNPLGKQTTSSSKSYSVSDIPAYPGGDRALNNYFKGKLRPIEIPKHQDQFDRNVLIELTINARGKLKDYKIRGQLHPTHQEALVEAIEELPRFNKGSEKITYSLGLSF